MMGADVVINIEDVPSIQSRTELVLSHTRHQAEAEVVFESASFLPATIEGMGYVRYGGTFVEVGHFVDMDSIEMNINRLMMRRNMRVEAIWGNTYEHFVRGLPILEKIGFPFQKMISHVLPLEQVDAGFKVLNGDYRLGDKTAIRIEVKGSGR
jgi:L-iditol 2-dehydrogenase